MDNTENPPQELELDPLDLLVCDTCFEKNLTENVHIQECVICNEEYCAHHASIVDPSHCNECLHDVSVTIETIQKIAIHENPETGHKTKRSRKARQITIGGLHWLFTQRKIPTLNDAELAVSIEYHRAFYDALVYEREKRRTEHFHRNANKPYKINTSSSGATLDNTVTTSKTTVKKSRTIKVVKPDAAAANLASLIEVLKKQGLSIEQIKAIAMSKK